MFGTVETTLRSLEERQQDLDRRVRAVEAAVAAAPSRDHLLNLQHSLEHGLETVDQFRSLFVALKKHSQRQSGLACSLFACCSSARTTFFLCSCVLSLY